MQKVKKQFIKDIWITGKYNNYSVIGRTFLLNGKKKVMIVSEFALSSIVDYDKIDNILKLKIV